jgi:hypothetical protein
MHAGTGRCDVRDLVARDSRISVSIHVSHFRVRLVLPSLELGYSSKYFLSSLPFAHLSPSPPVDLYSSTEPILQSFVPYSFLSHAPPAGCHAKSHLLLSTSMLCAVLLPFSFSSRFMRVPAAAKPMAMAKMGSRRLVKWLVWRWSKR